MTAPFAGPAPGTTVWPELLVGVDLTPVHRIRTMIAGDGRALNRILSPAERADCTDDRGLLDPNAVAGRIAAKEAAFKALHRPGPLPWTGIEVRTTPQGWPELSLADYLLPRADESHHAGKLATAVSISHDHGMAVAMVVIQRIPEESRVPCR